jgi:beta-1,4-mannosyl-glycoprotein beta-1,4-N-acetylglucosaminyltransferase
MIIDAFIFYNEIDLLHMRLEELYPVVDKFILVQAHHTFRGVPKEKSFDRKDPQWAPYIDKIHDIAIGLSGGKDAWEREAYQRNVISMELQAGYSLNDIAIISDVDEIPRREIVQSLPDILALENFKDGIQLDMKMYYYKLNVRQGGWTAVKALPVWKIDTAQAVRHRDLPTLASGGWHFSYLGDEEFISNKLRAFSHSELDTPAIHAGIADAIAQRKDLFGRDNLEFAVEVIDDSWPHAVVNNREYWKKHEW